jgi:hypothetical protein
MPAPAPDQDGQEGRQPLPAAIADGLRLLRRSAELLAVTAATTAGQFFQGPLPVLLPLLGGSLAGIALFLALLALAPSFWACLPVAAAAGFADGPALAATLTVRQGTVPPGRYAQVIATAASFKIAAYSAGAAAAGLLTGVLTIRELLLGLAAGQLLSAVPLLPAAAVLPAARRRGGGGG